MHDERSLPWYRRDNWLAVAFLLLLSFFTVFWNFWTPQALFWDENYHIASAQKYLNGVFFMEPHPPLGKLMIAAGEKLLNFNEKDDQFIDTDYAKNPPPGFIFTGYRFFPVLLAWLTVVLIFGIFFLLTRNTLWSTLLSFLYVFDNAILVHLRSAMLESTLIFFLCLTIFAFLLAMDERHTDKLKWIGLLIGAAFGAVMTTKVNGLILLLLGLPLLVRFWSQWRQLWNFTWPTVVGFLFVFCSVWQIHFSVADRILPALPDGGYYQASEEYKAILTAGATSNPLAFATMMRDSQSFVGHYEAGVPRLDLCKMDENGSPYFFWPIGGRTINYRWETPNEGFHYKYLYLVPNPVVWGVGLLGLLFTLVIFLSSAFLSLKELPSRKTLLLLGSFALLYLGYMGAMSTLDRVMYLYHYFPPLLFSFFLFAISFFELKRIAGWELNHLRRTSILMVLAALIFVGFEFYRPLSHYEPISDAAFERRSIIRLWEMKCVHCEKESMLVVPRN